MNISPVSFGKTVKVNASIDTARRIAELANSCKATSSEKQVQHQVKRIFDDVNKGEAIAVDVNGGRDVYILSGKETEQAKALYEEMTGKILDYNGSAKSKPSAFSKIMQDAQQKFNEFLFFSQAPFELDVEKNHKNTQIKGVSQSNWAGVYAVAGSKKQIDDLRDIVEKSEGKGYFMKATDLYLNRYGRGFCTEAVQNGKEVAFVVTGKEATDNVSFMSYGWSSINGISKHIDRAISLDNVKEQAKAIQEAMKH